MTKVKEIPLTQMERVEINLHVLDTLKEEALATCEVLSKTDLLDMDARFKLVRHSLELEVRKLLTEIKEAKELL